MQNPLRRLPALALLAALAGAVAALPAFAAEAGDTPQVDFEKYTLPNGLQVILHVDRNGANSGRRGKRRRMRSSWTVASRKL